MLGREAAPETGFFVRIMSCEQNEMRVRDQGQGFIELALVLPLLLVVVFGVFDLGRVYFSTIMLTSAAREGARYLSVNPDDVEGGFAGTREVAFDEARNSGIALELDEISTVCPTTTDPLACDSGFPATVTVSHDFELLLGWLLPSPISITRSAQMIVP
jgi:Flp pilus assembly protein TadG